MAGARKRSGAAGVVLHGIGNLLDLEVAFWRALLSPFGPSARERQLEESFRLEIQRYRHLLVAAFGRANTEQLEKLFQGVVRDQEKLWRGLVVWADLIEVLIQATEQRYGSTARVGPLKKEEVKGVLRYLARSYHLPIAGIPESLQPVLLDVLIDWSIDHIVVQLNSYRLWQRDGIGAGQRQLLRVVVATGRHLLRVALEAIGTVVARVVTFFERPPRFSPTLRAALDAVEREGLIAETNAVLALISRILVQLSTNRDSLAAASEIVYSVVWDVEDYVTLSGPEKHQRAKAFIWAVLEDLGIPHGTGLFSAFLDAGIDFLIDNSVRIFNRRNAFTHRSGPASESPTTPSALT